MILVSENKKSGASASGAAWLTAYCVGNVGYEMLYEFFENFQKFFLTELCHFSTTLTATLITIVNICKAIFPSIFGIIIDSNPLKARDKHAPWILGMPVLLRCGYRSAIPSLSRNSNKTGCLALGINTASNIGS